MKHKESKTDLKKAFIMWLVLALAYIIVQFHRVSFAVIADYVVVDFNIDKAWITGFLAGMYAVMYLVMQVPSGLLADWWGPRKTVFAGMLTTGAGTVLFIATDILFFAFLGRLFLGLGVSVVLVPAMKFQSNWFKPSQFATLTGMIIFLGNIGKLLGTSPLAYAVSIYDWRFVFLIVGIITGLIAFLVWSIVRDYPEKRRKENYEMNKVGAIKGGAMKDSFLRAIKNKYIWFLLIVGFGVAGPLLAFAGTWSVSYLMQIYDFSRFEASNFVMIMTVGTGIGALMIGYLSDHLGMRKKPLIALMTANIIVWLIMVSWNGGKPPAEFLYLVFFMVGFCLSGITLIISLAKELSEPEYSGTSIGVVNMGPFAGMALFQPLQGWLLELRWTGLVNELGNKIFPLEAFRLVFVVNLLVFLVSLYFAWKIRESESSLEAVEAKEGSSS